MRQLSPVLSPGTTALDPETTGPNSALSSPTEPPLRPRLVASYTPSTCVRPSLEHPGPVGVPRERDVVTRTRPRRWGLGHSHTSNPQVRGVYRSLRAFWMSSLSVPSPPLFAPTSFFPRGQCRVTLRYYLRSTSRPPTPHGVIDTFQKRAPVRGLWYSSRRGLYPPLQPDTPGSVPDRWYHGRVWRGDLWV